MAWYFTKRLLLIIPTLAGITLVSFLILQFVPGGPVDMEIMKYRMGSQSGTGETGSVSANSSVNIPESALKEIKEFYGFDKPLLTRYGIWLEGIATGNLGKSTFYSEPVTRVIADRFPVSIYFGIIGFLLTYLVCVPLGIMKAVKNGSKFDFISSFLVFAGYSIPGWAFGALIIVLLGGGSFLDIFPLGGFVSPDYDNLSFAGKIIDVIYHTILPVSAYMISGFATLTILTKNSLIEVLSQDYIKTAYAKGLSDRRVIIKHVFRNSLIPLATGFGHFLSVILTGSILIEKVFNIPGLGMLAFDSILNRDYPVSMGILVISSFLMLAGNIISDILYAAVDPRIRFK
jgi:microcin C transport system permease protein